MRAISAHTGPSFHLDKENSLSLSRIRIRFPAPLSLVDILLLVGLAVFVYSLVGIAEQWVGPFRPRTEIDLGFISLIGYAGSSLVRVFCAYLLSLVFTFAYGYAAAKSKMAEPILIPILDILQSVPVTAFMPALVLALVKIFPNSNLGLEFAAVVMIFTGQGWNMVFSFYSSLKAVPAELRDMSRAFGLGPLETLAKVEIPFATNGLLWNSMLSMAGGWFFLMVIESFTLGAQDFRLPGLGSYMAVAYAQNNLWAVVAGILTMLTIIVAVDRCLWAPLVVWSYRFQMDADSTRELPRSMVLEWLKRSDVVSSLEKAFRSTRVRASEMISRARFSASSVKSLSEVFWVGRWTLIFLGIVSVVVGGRVMAQFLASTPTSFWLQAMLDSFFTLLRVFAAVALGSLWTIPVGVWIGTHPKWTRRMQPVVQVVASFPAPMLFPVIFAGLTKLGMDLGIGSIVLMIFSSQWYILFNVISGATLIPRTMLDLASAFQVRGWRYWSSVALPAIFPSLLNGWITAAGGAWNSCIVAEYVEMGGQHYIAQGIGATITRSATDGNYRLLAASVLTLVTLVVILNRVLWGNLYRLAETRYRLESSR